MMRKMTALVVMALLVAACNVETDTDMRDDAAVDAGTPEAAAPGATAGDAALPPDDGDVRTVDATLTEWSISLAQERVAAGAIAFNVRNAGSVVHRFEVEGNGEEWATEDINPGDDITMSLNLTPGVYQVYCPVVTDGEDHEAQGMTTTLNVY